MEKQVKKIEREKMLSRLWLEEIEKFYGYGKEKKEDEGIGEDRRVYSVGVYKK